MPYCVSIKDAYEVKCSDCYCSVPLPPKISLLKALIGGVTVGTLAYAKLGNDETINKIRETSKKIPIIGSIIPIYFNLR